MSRPCCCARAWKLTEGALMKSPGRQRWVSSGKGSEAKVFSQDYFRVSISAGRMWNEQHTLNDRLSTFSPCNCPPHASNSRRRSCSLTCVPFRFTLLSFLHRVIIASIVFVPARVQPFRLMTSRVLQMRLAMATSDAARAWVKTRVVIGGERSPLGRSDLIF